MKKYIIAGIKVAFDYQYQGYFNNNLEFYEYDGDDIEHVIYVHFEQVLTYPKDPNHYIISKSSSEVKAYITYDEGLKHVDLWIDNDAFVDTATAEFVYLGMIFNYLAQYHGKVLLSSTAFSYDNEAILLVAPSGSGKSTHAKMWKDNFPDNVVIINDAKPIVDIINNEVVCYATPFSELNSHQKEEVKVKAIVFIEKGIDQSVYKLSEVHAGNLMHQNINKQLKANPKELTKKINEITSLVDNYRFEVNLDKALPKKLKTHIFGS